MLKLAELIMIDYIHKKTTWPNIFSSISSPTRKIYLGFFGVLLSGFIYLSVLQSPSQAQIIANSASFFDSPFAAGYVITSGFLNNWGCSSDSTLHPGLDMVGLNGDKDVRSVADGVVTFVHKDHSDSGFGDHLEIRHTLADGSYVYSHYAHLVPDSIPATFVEGQPVHKKQKIGVMGHSGNVYSTSGGDGSHLHFEMRVNESVTDDAWPECKNLSIQANEDEITNWVAGGEVPRYVNPETFMNNYNTLDKIKLFEHSYFRGNVFEIDINGLPTGGHQFQNLSLAMNDKVSSIAMPSRIGIDLYQNANKQGAHIFSWQNDMNLAQGNNRFSPEVSMNDNISSLEFFDIGVGTSVSNNTISQNSPPTIPPNAWAIKYFNYDPNNSNNKWECTPDRYHYVVGTYPFMDWGDDGASSDPIEGNDCQPNFIAELTASKHFEPGTYTAYLYADDQARMEVIGAGPQNMVVDRWDNTTSPIETFTINTSGNHDVRVYFKDNGGSAWVQAWWEGPQNSSTPLYPSMKRETRDVNQWFGEYYGVRHTPLDSVVQVNEGNGLPFTKDWGGASPGFGLPSNLFSSKFERLYDFECGWYTFNLDADDKGTLTVDPQLPLLQITTQQANNPVSAANVFISGGKHLVELRHREEYGDAKITVNWTLQSTCPAPTPTPTEIVTPTPTPSLNELELLTQAWHLTGNNGAAEAYQTIDSNSLLNKTHIRVTYDLHGLNALGNDASAIIFDQGDWRFASLANYGQNGLNGTQTVEIPLSSFPNLNPNSAVGTLHTRFWYGSAFTVDITSIKAIGASSQPTPTPSPTATPTPTPTITPTPVSGVELLSQPWHLTGNNGADEKYQNISTNALNGKTKIRVTYDLHGLSALGGDASAIIFDQGDWRFVGLANYGQNGYNGTQTVEIPLSDFANLNPNANVGTLHTRFWASGAFTVDITSIKAVD
jgi:murein DD-endopeptidase MepM/ murein hydrolase activator NlpD